MQTSKSRTPAQKHVETPEESLSLLNEYKREFERQFKFAKDAKERFEKLMLRKSMARKTADKRQQMIRRHLDATSQMETAQRMLDQVYVRIEQLTTAS